MKKAVLIFLTLATLLTVAAACGKKTETETDPNAVLTDSNVPLDVGAELWNFGTQTETNTAQ